MVPSTPRTSILNGVNGSSTKRRSDFETPAAKASKNHAMSSPSGFQTPFSNEEAASTKYVCQTSFHAHSDHCFL